MTDWLSREDVEHLLTQPGTVCWWCQSRPADSGEHKYKRSDLAATLGDDDELYHVVPTESRLVRLQGRGALKRDRYGVLKFPKIMCAYCNNTRSQPFDRSYEHFIDAVRAEPKRFQKRVDLAALFGPSWPVQACNLARYYVKHFACRMVISGLQVPRDLTDFLDGAVDMPMVSLRFIRTREIAWITEGLALSPDAVHLSPDRSRVDSYTGAMYVGNLGVRFNWDLVRAVPHEGRFFHYGRSPVLEFLTEEDVAMGRIHRSSVRHLLSSWWNRDAH